MFDKLKTFFRTHIFISVGAVTVLILAVLIIFTLANLNNEASGGGKIPPPGIASPADTAAAAVDDGIEFLRKQDYDNFALRIKNLKDVNAMNQKGQTLMDAAVYFGVIDAANILIYKGADVNLANPNTGETPLMTALRANNDKMIEFLIAAGANLNAVSARGATPLLIAVANKNDVWIDRLISRGSTAGASGENLLTFVSGRNAEGVSAMLRSGVSPNIKNSGGYAPLFMAAAVGDLPNVKLLASYKADLDAPAPDGSTALIASARYRHADALEFLLNKGANVNARDNKGATALYWAAVNNMVKSIDQLLVMKADASLKPRGGLTPFQTAQQYKYVAALSVFQKYNVTR